MVNIWWANAFPLRGHPFQVGGPRGQGQLFQVEEQGQLWVQE